MLKNNILLFLVFLTSVRIVFTQETLPTIKLLIPKDTPVLCTKPFVPIKAIVDGISDKNDIEVLFNDQYFRRFTYDTSNNVLRMQIDIKEEKNVLSIQAENNIGSAQFDLNINYKNPLSLLGPNIELIYPKTSNFISYRDTIRVRALIEMVSEYDIILNLNGQIIDEVKYDLDSEVMSALLKLDAGENFINVSASNSGGITQKTFKIIYRP